MSCSRDAFPVLLRSTQEDLPEGYSNPDETDLNETHGSRYDAQNFNNEDVDQLLDIVAQFESIDQNGWTRVKSAYNSYWKWNERQYRSIETLRKKFNRLLYTQRQTKEPRCLPSLWRARRIKQKKWRERMP